MVTFRDLKKASKLNIPGKEIRMVVLGNTATQLISTAILGNARMEGINLKLVDTDYNQIDVQIHDNFSETYKTNPDYIFLWLSTDKLYEEFLDCSLELHPSFADNYIEKIEDWWNKISENSKATVLQPNLPEIDDKAFGQFSAKTEYSFIYQVRKLNFLLQERMLMRKNVLPIDFAAIQNQVGRDSFYDSALYYSSKISISINMLPLVSKAVTDVLKSVSGKIHKCIVLDLDNTLWGGVIGDDGLGGIEIGELGRGHAFTNFQRWLRQLKECGIILTVCSKNDENIAKEPFEKLSEMILKLSDFSVFVANWDDKASNIRMIRDTLNIGMDSMVFIDDNPFERNLVREMIPEITVPELPDDPVEYVDFLQKENLFDTVTFIGCKSDRTKMYQEEFERKKSEKTFDSVDDYLKSLDMKAIVKEFEPVMFARIAQLSQRSNQFNLRTVRYTENDVAVLAQCRDVITLSFSMYDKFGDYGLISAVVLKKQNSNELFIDNWFMSCRVLKRGMEAFILNYVIKVAETNGYERINAEYIPTLKNKLVENIYSEMGFEQTSDNHYSILVKDFILKPVWINIE